MAEAAGLKLPHEWRQFVLRYGSDKAYWYVPKGLAVSTDSLRPRLKVLKEFEGGPPWRECQERYITRLNEEHISDARADWDGGGAPLARMLKQVFAILGLAWVDPNHRVEITPAGEKFLASNDPDGVLSDQLARYQFWNPSIAANHHKPIQLHPIPFLGVTLRDIDGQAISATEYILFVSRAKTFDEVDRVLELIYDYRSLDKELQDAIAKTCDEFMLGGLRRSSMFNTIKLNRSYALKMWSLSRLITMDDSRLMLERGSLKHYRKYLADYEARGAYIHFDNKEDWIAYYGEPSAAPSLDTALDYYVNKGDVDAAIATKERTAKSKKELRNFTEMLLSEKAIEDYLEHNLDFIGKKIGATLTLIGRQYSTPVGPIDLLAQDKKTGDYVVIELKKGRSADKVYGQCSRYMGWIRKNLADDKQVHGAIIARKIDDKLAAARDGHDTKVHLIEFEMKVGGTVV